MKKALAAILALGIMMVVLVGVVWLIWTAPPAVQALLAAAAGFLVSRFYETWKESKARLYEKKRDVYANLLAPYRDVIVSVIQQGETKSEPPLGPEFVRKATEAAFDAILYASDDVIRQYGNTRQSSVQGQADPTVALVNFAVLLKAIRRDLGHWYTSLDEMHILAMFVNFKPGERERLQTVLGTKSPR